METYTILRLKKISERISEGLTKDGSPDFFKGFLESIKRQIDETIMYEHLVMKEGFYETDRVKQLLINYDYTPQYIDDSGQRHKAERKNNEIEKELKELGVLEFRNIKINN